MADASFIDLTGYFERIGYGGPAAPTLQVLAAIQQSHAATIPFDTLDAFMHGRVDLSPESVDRKLIAERRGGYCFEHNGLLRRVLLALGYEVTSLIGRNLYGRADDAPILPRVHQALTVRIDGEEWLVDVGNGVVTPTAPLNLRDDAIQSTPHGQQRVLRIDGEIVLQTQDPEGWSSVYSLSPAPQHEADFEPANWWNCAHPDSWLRQNLICALSPVDSRITLLNNRVTVRRLNERPSEMVLDLLGLEQCLTEVFGIPTDPAWRPYLKRAVRLGQGAV